MACAWLWAGCSADPPAQTPRDAQAIDAPAAVDTQTPADVSEPDDVAVAVDVTVDVTAPVDAPTDAVTPRDAVTVRDASPRDVGPRDVGPTEDLDGDGSRSDVDCNDRNARIHPGAVDLCSDGVDQDCNGRDNVCACTKRLHVLVDDYGTVDGRALEARSNGCWEVHSVNDRVPLEFRHCIHGVNTAYACGGHIRQFDGDDWYYDDTNRSHDDDVARIRECATRCGMSPTPAGTGFVTMAASGGWVYQDASIAGVRFFAQLYTSDMNEDLQGSLVTSWRNDRRAAPMVSLTHATAAQMASWTASVCAPLTNGNWIGYYVGSGRGGAAGLGALQADDYLAWSRALNTCSR